MMTNYTGPPGGYWQSIVGSWNQRCHMPSYYPRYPAIPNYQMYPAMLNNRISHRMSVQQMTLPPVMSNSPMRLMMEEYHMRFTMEKCHMRLTMEKYHMPLIREKYWMRLEMENCHMGFMEKHYKGNFFMMENQHVLPMVDNYHMRLMMDNYHMRLMISNYHLRLMMKNLMMSNYHMSLLMKIYLNPRMMPKYTYLLNIYWSTVGESWKPVLVPEFYKQYFINLCDFLTRDKEELKTIKRSIYPPEEDVFAWTRSCNIEDVKVVIVGQDPYPWKGKAHGLSFSVKLPHTSSKSLNKIYKKLRTDIPGFVSPNHGDLTSWAKQGVLLLNSILTVRAKNPEPEKPEPDKDKNYKVGAGSHENRGWEILTNAVISHLNDNYSGIVFMLWGDKAQMKKIFINDEKHLVLCCGHPNRQRGDNLFRDCEHFSQANEYLKEGKGGINWNLHPIRVWV
ncbi:uncharacterized protein LOC144422237 [Styela clava]